MTDASLQCRYRKSWSFAPPWREPEVETELERRTRKLAEHCGYVGVGTLEYLVDASRVYLIEGSARLNTGFHLWERVAGTSAVAWQLAALQGVRPGRSLLRASAGVGRRSGIAFYAEDSLLQFPQPGEIREVTEKREWHFGNPGFS